MRGALPIQALMVDVDGVLVDGRPEDGRGKHLLKRILDSLLTHFMNSSLLLTGRTSSSGALG